MMGYEVPNEEVFGVVQRYCSAGPIHVVIEDIRAYEGGFGQYVIDTCKFIGELQYCLKSAAISFTLIPRSTVKSWLYTSLNATCKPLVEKIIRQRKLVNKDGQYRAPSHAFVNDRVVATAMRVIWDLKKPKPGHKLTNGMKGHAIQALAVGTCYLQMEAPGKEATTAQAPPAGVKLTLCNIAPMFNFGEYRFDILPTE